MFQLVFHNGDCPEADSFIEQWADNANYITAHTSGSTGVPKAIHLPKRDMMVSAKATNERFAIDSNSRLVSPLSAGYIAGKMMIVRAIMADCEALFLSPSNHFWTQLPSILKEGDIDLLPIVPSQALTMISAEMVAMLQPLHAAIRNVIIGGAPLSADVERELRLLYPSTSFYATYGMTETCSHVALRPLGTEHFEAMPGITFSADSRNCLEIEAPAYSFGHLTTNDVVELIDPSHFRWLGRADNTINTGGVKVQPEEIEKLLAPFIPFPFYIKGVPDEKWGEQVALAIVAPGSDKPISFTSDKPSENSSKIPTEVPTDEELFALCRSVIANPYHRPRAILRIPALPLTPNGKLRRH